MKYMYKPLCPTVVLYAFIFPYLGGISTDTLLDILLRTPRANLGRKEDTNVFTIGPSDLTFSDTSCPSCPCLLSACSEGGSSPHAPSGHWRSWSAPPAWCPGWQTAPPPGHRWCPCPWSLCRAPWFKQHFFCFFLIHYPQNTIQSLWSHNVDSERFTSTVFFSKGSAWVGGSP